MKKKILALLLAAVMVCSFAACGNKPTEQNSEAPHSEAAQTGEQETIDYENAIEATAHEVFEAVRENQAKAMQNIYKVTGSIDVIKGDYCTIDNLCIYLPSDELAALNKGDFITFAGQITDVEEENYEMAGGRFTEIDIKFENAVRIIDDRKAVAE